MFIVLEGLDAVGKNTQSQMLEEKLTACGRKTSRLSFPRYETELGAAISRHLRGETALIRTNHVGQVRLWSSRLEKLMGDTFPPSLVRASEDAMVFQCMMTIDRYHAAASIVSLLRKGYFVVSDRWSQSGEAFGAAEGIDAKWLRDVQSRLPKGDLNILISISEEEALRRRPKLRDRYETNRELQALVRGHYQRIWSEGVEKDRQEMTKTGWVMVDGEGSPEEVHERIWKQVVDGVNNHLGCRNSVCHLATQGSLAS